MTQDPVKFCQEILKKVSRSFALTIPLLDPAIREPVMIVYLQDRLLDNFEDELPGLEQEKRKELMDRVVAIFQPGHSHLPEAVREIQGWTQKFSSPAHQELVAGSDLLWQAYHSLAPEVKKTSYRWLEEMNRGMQQYLDREISSFAQLDEYCYYVAGTVGGFLTDLILLRTGVSSEKSRILQDNFVDAGLFLQKVNITRDIKEDIESRSRIFWPLAELGVSKEGLLDPDKQDRALEALDQMINSAASHIEPLLTYYNALPRSLKGYRRFFAVNNALGLATLNKIRSNPEVFQAEKPVKISKLSLGRVLKSPEKRLYQLAETF